MSKWFDCLKYRWDAHCKQARYRSIENEIADAQEECAELGIKIGQLITERENLKHELERT